MINALSNEGDDGNRKLLQALNREFFLYSASFWGVPSDKANKLLDQCCKACSSGGPHGFWAWLLFMRGYYNRLPIADDSIKRFLGELFPHEVFDMNMLSDAGIDVNSPVTYEIL